MTTNFSDKLASLFLFVALAFANRLQYRTSDFKKIYLRYLVTSCKHLVNFGPVTPEFKIVKCVDLLSISSLATFALLFDLVGDQC